MILLSNPNLKDLQDSLTNSSKTTESNKHKINKEITSNSYKKKHKCYSNYKKYSEIIESYCNNNSKSTTKWKINKINKNKNKL